MAVAFDAVGPSSSGASGTAVTTLSWTHTAAAGAALTAWCAYDASSDTGVTMSAALDPAGANTPMGSLSPACHSNGQTAGFGQMFGLANVASGSHTVKITVTSSGDLEGGSVSYSGADASSPFSAAQTSIPSGTGTQTTASITFTGSSAGNMVTAGLVAGSAINSPSPGTSRWITNTGGSGAGGCAAQADAAGGGSVTITWTHTADWDAIAAVEVKAPQAAAAAPAAQPGRTWLRRFRHPQFLPPGPPPAVAAPPAYPFAELAQRRETQARGLPRRSRAVLLVSPQPEPLTEVTQRRQAWPRGLPRRAKITVVVPPQLNPPYPFAGIRQNRQPRGLFPRTGNSFIPVPAQQATPSAPAFVPQPPRHVRLALTLRRRAPAAVPAAQDTPPQQARRAPRAAGPPRRSRPAAFLHGQDGPPPRRSFMRQRPAWLRRRRITWPPQAQAPAAPPAWVPPHRAPARALTPSRRGRIAWPPQAQAPAAPPAWVQSHRSPLRAAVPSRRGHIATPPHGQAHAPYAPARRGPLRALALIRRRFRQLLPWPQAVQPSFSVGTVTAADTATAALTASASSSTMTAATAAQGTLTATDQRTGGPG